MTDQAFTLPEYEALKQQMNRTPHEHDFGVMSHAEASGEYWQHCCLCDHEEPISEDEWDRRREASRQHWLREKVGTP